VKSNLELIAHDRLWGGKKRAPLKLLEEGLAKGFGKRAFSAAKETYCH